MEFISKKFVDKDGKMFHTGVGQGDIAPSVLMPGDPDRSKIISGALRTQDLSLERGRLQLIRELRQIRMFLFRRYLRVWDRCP